MPITIACPSCGSKAKAPDSAAGRVLKCPKCGTALTIPAATNSPDPTPPSAEPAQPTKACPYCGEKILAVAKKCKHCGEMLDAPIQTEERTARGQPSRRPAEENEDEEDEQPRKGRARRGRAEDEDEDEDEEDDFDERPRRRRFAGVKDKTDAFGVISLIFGALSAVCMLLGCCTCGATYYAAAPFALVGAGLGFFARGNLKVAGLVLNFLALIPAIILTFLFATGMAVTTLGAGAAAGASTSRPGVAGPGGQGAAGQGGPEWIDASKNAAPSGDVSVAVVGCAVDHVNLEHLGEASRSQNKQLIIRIRIANNSQTKKIDYESWGDTSGFIDKHVPKLSDNLGNKYKRIEFGFGTEVAGQLKQAAIHPGKTVDDFLIFEEPLANADKLLLELPASAFGGTKDIKFEIPKAMIARP